MRTLGEVMRIKKLHQLRIGYQESLFLCKIKHSKTNGGGCLGGLKRRREGGGGSVRTSFSKLRILSRNTIIVETVCENHGITIKEKNYALDDM